MSKGGRPRKIGDAEKRLLRQLVEETPLATLDEITEAFCTRTGLSVHHMTVRRRLDEMGIRREQATLPPPQGELQQRYGYRPAHRRQTARTALPQLAHRRGVAPRGRHFRE
ncbi:helix-turn-helix domain-containing protein [Halomonas sp. TRM85114]|uniref:hypothetical protein n=1 Tax=Halomonas jincaotanensis TaxID=2810616 RepID=UPI001BD42D59|nr:helix-turn-helix domain-containing protein [Halomonas jincaotanensis]